VFQVEIGVVIVGVFPQKETQVQEHMMLVEHMEQLELYYIFHQLIQLIKSITGSATHI
jgi:hypothetical protein